MGYALCICKRMRVPIAGLVRRAGWRSGSREGRVVTVDIDPEAYHACSLPTGRTQFGRPPDERGGDACDISIVEPVDVVVLWILLSCGGQISRELLDGDGRPQVVPQRGEQAGRRPGRAAQ